MRPASDAEKARLNDTFAALCRIPSSFGRERACAQHVAAELRAMGLEVAEDDAAATTGAECGNLLARLPGRGERSILLCGHLDTVDDGGVPIEPVVVDGGWANANAGILGADNKAAVAVILELARRCSVEGSPVGLELLFTVSEENALAGAKAFDASVLQSDFGYVFDHATPIGEIVTASPTYFRIAAEFHGRAAHAGIRPEDGRSAILAAAHAIAAMPLGRIDDETTANVGSVSGGVGSTNVVAERAQLLAEARSLDPEKAEQTVARMIDAISDGAAAAECDVDITTKRLFAGYRQKPSAPAVAAAEAALRACGYEPRRIATGGGSDANALELSGFSCVNLANGTERNHEPTERVSVAALEGMLDVVLALLDESAALPAPEPPAAL
jgi:tripeptide aminopeptidase